MHKMNGSLNNKAKTILMPGSGRPKQTIREILASIPGFKVILFKKYLDLQLQFILKILLHPAQSCLATNWVALVTLNTCGWGSMSLVA